MAKKKREITPHHKNVLSRRESRKVEDMLLNYQEEIEGGKWTMDSLAERATTLLGRPVTLFNVRSCAKSLEITFPRSKKRLTKKESDSRIQFLARNIAELRHELEAHVSPELAAIAGELLEDE